MTYKFRGISTVTNDWVYGSLIQREDSFGPFSLIEVQHKFPHEPEQVHVIAESVGQFTGLKDKNGKDVYEGDLYITEEDGKEYKVMFVAGAFVGGTSEHPDECMPLGWDVNDEEISPDLPNWFEVIGNIHEVNPASGQSGVNHMQDPNTQQQETNEEVKEQVAEGQAQQASEEVKTESAEEGSTEG